MNFRWKKEEKGKYKYYKNILQYNIEKFKLTLQLFGVNCSVLEYIISPNQLNEYN